MISRRSRLLVLAVCFGSLLALAAGLCGEELSWTSTQTLPAAEAHQAAAADEQFVFAIGSRSIAKYDRATRVRIAASTGEAEHLNSGFLAKGKLYCAHSNYPKTPEQSEIKVLEIETMRLSTFKDFGNFGGSLTWAVSQDGYWWCNFARYGSANAGTFLVKFDGEWREQKRWTYPPDVVQQIGQMSLSGGLWRNGSLLVTDHDHGVLYELKLPADGNVLQFVGAQAAPFTGQGIADDPLTGGLVGIHRAKKLVVFANFQVPFAGLRTGRKFSAEQFARKTIYHSPETPGYTCWVGAWQMPDKSLMVSFKQATGPIENRPTASQELLQKLGRVGDFMRQNPKRDFTGLKLANIYLQTKDGGATWQKVAESPFPGPIDRPVFEGSHTALSDGTILRAIDGSQLPLVPDLPRRIFFQRSADLGKSWGRPEIPPQPERPLSDYLGDYGDCITRVRRSRDGGLIATGVSRLGGPIPHVKGQPEDGGRPVIMFSHDEAKTWQAQQITLTDDQLGPRVWNEWDCAELPSGELLAVFRRSDPANRSKQVRWQGVFRKQGIEWKLENYQASALAHSGHPELLMTREGVVLHLATEGIHSTADAGKTWLPVAFPNLGKSFRPPGEPTSLRTRYYPRSLQTEDGRIYVLAHHGFDNAYGDFDQSIVMDSFRLSEN